MNKINNEFESYLSTKKKKSKTSSEALSTKGAKTNNQNDKFVETFNDCNAEYYELLKNFYQNIGTCELKPESHGKLIITPPRIFKISVKKVGFVNFLEICNKLNRPYKHFKDFILSELSTTGSFNNDQCLIIRGKYYQKHFEEIIRNYIKQYVFCNQCKSSNTIIICEKKLTFLKCENCNSKYSVSKI